MHTHSLPVLCSLWVSLAFSHVTVADNPIEVIELNSRLLDEVLPIIQPLVREGETVTGMGSNLVIMASPERVGEFRRLLLELDKPPRRLVISVSNAGEESRRSSGYAVSADIQAGDGRVGINSPRRAEGTRARVSVHDRDGEGTRTTHQRVQALEGSPAYIGSGSRVPFRVNRRYSVDGIPFERHTRQLHDVTSGFYVVPRLSGEFVNLEIMQQDNRPGRGRGVYQTQRTGTVVRARLGEWVELGGINENSRDVRSGIGTASGRSGQSGTRLRVMVECIDCPN